MKREAMEILDRLKGRRDAMPVVLVVASATLAVLVLVQVAGFFTDSTWAMNIASKAALTRKSADTNALEESRKAADELKKKNLFAPPEAKQHPVREVPGILGSQAFVNGRWYGEGQNIADAKVVSVEPTQVKIEWEGDEKAFVPIMSSTSGPSGPERRPGDDRGGRPDDKSDEKRPDVVVNVQGGPGGFRGPFPGGGPFGGDMRERFMNMSEQERQAFRDRMRAQFGGGGPGGFRGPGGGDFGRGRPDFGGGRGSR